MLIDNSRRLLLLHRLLQQEGVNGLRAGITPRDRSTNFHPLSYAQRRLWFLNQLEPKSPSYNIPAAVRLTGSLDVWVLERALSEIYKRHEVLRTTFPMMNGRPFQLISDPKHFTLPVIDLTELPAAERQMEAGRLTLVEAQRPFDLALGPLLRANLIRLAQEEQILALCAHHIVFDGRSIVIFFRELKTLYAALSRDQQTPLSELRVQYADYTAWQSDWLQGEVLNRQLAYWKKQLAGAPAMLNLPTDYPRPEVQGSRGASQKFSLTTELTESLRKQSQLEGVTLFMTLLTSWLILLFYHCRQDDILIGTDVANRNQVELEELIGFFANQLVLRVSLEGNPSFRELLGRVRSVTLGAYAHQDLPFEQLIKHLKLKREPGRTPLFQVKFLLVNEPGPLLELPGLKVEALEIENCTAKYDLLLAMVNGRDGLTGILEYNTDLMKADRVARMLEEFRVLLTHVAQQPEAHIQELIKRLEEENRWRARKEQMQLKAVRHRRLTNVKPKSIAGNVGNLSS